MGSGEDDWARPIVVALLQLTDSFWKPASGAGTENKAEAEAEAEEETPATDQTAVAEDTDNDDEESSQEAPAEDDAADEESSTEAPTEIKIKSSRGPESTKFAFGFKPQENHF